MNQPLELEAWFLNSLSVEYVPATGGEPCPPPKPQFQINLQSDPGNPLRFMVELGVSVNQAEATPGVPYRIRAVVTGIFRFPEGTTPGDVAAIIPINGPTILYGILRGHVDALTALSFGPRYTLPTVYFRDVIRDLAAQQPAPVADRQDEMPSRSARKKPTSRPSRRRGTTKP